MLRLSCRNTGGAKLAAGSDSQQAGHAAQGVVVDPFFKPSSRCDVGVQGGGGGSPGENFAGKISPLRKVAKFAPGEILA